MNKKLIGLAIATLLICSGIGMWLDFKKSEQYVVPTEEVMAAVLTTDAQMTIVDTVLSLIKDRNKPAPGYTIISDGNVFTHIDPEGDTSTFNQYTYEEAVKWSWDMYDYYNKPDHVWEVVDK
jgi:hypothetical protein